MYSPPLSQNDIKCSFKYKNFPNEQALSPLIQAYTFKSNYMETVIHSTLHIELTNTYLLCEEVNHPTDCGEKPFHPTIGSACSSNFNNRPPPCQAMIPPGDSFLGSQGNKVREGHSPSHYHW
jgi:hypothetical protein